ncbi:glucose-6-phosphate dehydrogenase [Sphingobium indicum]|nr:glucose-6-phosphate dehydrogenase [Sphingobium indicum]
MRKAPIPPAATIVVFGAMGDLARRLLMPALVNLKQSGLLHRKTTFLGVSHDEGDAVALYERLSQFVEKNAEWDSWRENIDYLAGEFEDPAIYELLANRLKGDVIFYLATAPAFFAPIAEALGHARLLDEADGFRRIVIEKPFGTDLASARTLNQRLLAQASEQQLYRIDHFLGKETVQNILVTRFGNAMTEAVWNNHYVDHIQITAAETVTIGSRGAFYDATGALRDMVPNHLFQLLALIGMEPPISLDAEALRTERAKVIAAIRPIDPMDAVRGRYTDGAINGEAVANYRSSPGVATDSRTETYVALKLMVETWRWHGVPFYLRTGKALKARDTEIIIRFREAPLSLFRDAPAQKLPPNRLVLQIQPREGLALEWAVKQPGPLLQTTPASLRFAYADLFDLGHRTGYETLLYDVLVGDQTLFQRADQIEEGWRAIQPLLDAWRSGEPDEYVAGSAGPDAADALIARDNRTWHAVR